MAQHFELGKYLRKRYIEGEPYRLLNSSYSRFEVSLRNKNIEIWKIPLYRTKICGPAQVVSS